MRTRITKIAHNLSEVPVSPAIYAMYAGSSASRHCVYVGQASNLKRRLHSHLVLRNSSVVTGVSAVSLNIEFVTEIEWWLNGRFHNKTDRGAAELVAFDRFAPVLRSRGKPSVDAKNRASEFMFRREFEEFFSQIPNGRLVRSEPESLLKRVESLEARVAALEQEAGVQ